MTIIRGMSMSDYLSNGNVGHHQLKDFSVSPRLYRDKYIARANVALLEDDDCESAKEAAKESRALVFGRAFETLLCDVAAFDKAYIQKPAAGKESSFTTIEGKAWKAAALARGLEILSVKEMAQMQAMRDSFREHPDAATLIEGCEQQVTFTCSDDIGGMVTLQSRPDFVNLKGSALSEFRPYSVDLKTVDHMERFYSGRAPLEYGYHRQAAIARICMEANGSADTVHYLLACEKSSPNRTELFELETPLLEHADGWVYARVVELTEAIKADVWPRARDTGIKTLKKPAWLKDEDM